MTHKINLKFYLDDGREIEPQTWLKTFNAWIPATPDEVLVDVADYSHIPSGPVTLLAGHEANTSIDNTDGELGLLYARKQPAEGEFPDWLRAAFRAALKTCRRLEEDPTPDRPVRFRGDRVLLVLNDRLLCPNTDETLAAVRPHLQPLLKALYGGAETAVRRTPDSRHRFGLYIQAEGEFSVADLLENLEKNS